jgi:hypothetical protein
MEIPDHWKRRPLHAIDMHDELVASLDATPKKVSARFSGLGTHRWEWCTAVDCV